MLLAGASLGGISAIRGALSFDVNNSPSWSVWSNGSAKIPYLTHD